jgi:protein TonB
VTAVTVQQSLPATLSKGPRPAALRRSLATRDGISWWSVMTLVLWTGCLTIGFLGLVLPYSCPHPPANQPEPIQAQILNVELANDPLPPPDVAPPPPNVTQPPPLSEPVVPQAAPPMIAVAQPSPAIAFALPVEGPARIVEARQATYVQPPTQTTSAPIVAPTVQQLIYGEGEGRQPAPDYPYQSLRAGQEGTVRVRLLVGENGRVQTVEAAQPCPWGLLNAAAIRVVRERWRFPMGAIRIYEVAIRFEIRK